MSRNEIDYPLLILAPERSFGSLVCAMLGQHPEMYGLLETRLFARNEMHEWFEDFENGTGSHGLIRSVAEVVFGSQSEPSIREARGWLRNRANRSTVDVFSELAETIYPLVLVERTAMITYRSQHMHRVRRQFHEMRFLHLVLHPALHGHSLVQYFNEFFQARPRGAFKGVSNPESIFCDLIDIRSGEPSFAPHRPWHRCHASIVKFLANIPKERKRQVRVEDLIRQPEQHLKEIVEWLELEGGSSAIEEMMHPEQSSFAMFGPSSARYGADPRFLSDPKLRFSQDYLKVLRKLAHEEDSALKLTPEVEELVRYFGYDQ